MENEKDPLGKNPHHVGAKLDDGKIQASLLGDFQNALMAVAEVATHGAQKYSKSGWLAVSNGIERYSDAMWRHILANDEITDHQSGLLHASHVAWNALAVLELILRSEKAPFGIEGTNPMYTWSQLQDPTTWDTEQEVKHDTVHPTTHNATTDSEVPGKSPRTKSYPCPTCESLVPFGSNHTKGECLAWLERGTRS